MKKLLFIIIAALFFQTAEAQLEIEIISGNASALPIAIVPFDWQNAGPTPASRVDEIISGDLYRSGLFDPMEVKDMVERPTESEEYSFRNLAAAESRLHRDRQGTPASRWQRI